mgnify:CR=1 FL=1
MRLLPGEYAPPRGVLLIALIANQPAGCCALRPLDQADYPNACEIKRLYVKPSCRGFGIGRQITETILNHGGILGYSSALLDTLNEMECARTMYQDLGFWEIPPYYHNPIAGAHYLRVDL